MKLHALLLAFLHAVHPAAPKMRDAPIILKAIETVVQEEPRPVFGTREADAIVLSYTAWAESNLHLRAVGDHGQVRGAFQLHSPAGNGDALTQAHAALEWLRRDREICPGMAMQAFMSGNCHRGHRPALHRMVEIQRALMTLRRARILT